VGLDCFLVTVVAVTADWELLLEKDLSLRLPADAKTFIAGVGLFEVTVVGVESVAMIGVG